MTMGIIARQSTKRSIISFIGVLIGAFSTLFIYPLDKEIYGLALFMFSMAQLLVIFMSLGSDALVLKYFPVFEKKKIPGFLTLMMLAMLLSIAVTTLIILFSKNFLLILLSKAGYNTDLIISYASPIYFLTVLLIFCYLIINHTANHKRIVVPAIFFDLAYKLLLPVLVFCVFVNMITETQFIDLYLLFFVFVLIGLLLYLFSLGGLKFPRIQFKSISIPLRKEMLTYMFFSGLNRLGSTIVARIDTIMVATLISLEDTGIYGILLFMANVIDIPVRAINQIASPVISASMEHGERDNVSRIYKKSSINALVIGVFIFLLIWGLLNNLFQIMPDGDDFNNYKFVFFFLALGKLIDMGFSTNSHILIYSKFYKYNLFFVLFLGILNLILNYFLIGEYGLTGAALASAISLVLYNLIKLFFIRIKLHYWPFTINSIKILLVAIFLYVLIGFLPDVFMAWPDIFLKAGLIFILYYVLIKIVKLNADVIQQGEQLIFKWFRRPQS